MADLIIPAGAVTARDGDPVLTKKAQVAVTAGQVLYEDSSNGGKLNLADADVEASAKMVGIATGDADADEYVTAALPGSVITVASGIFTVGQVYYVSTTAGGIAPLADLAASDYVTLCVVGLTTTTALVLGEITGVTV